MPIALSDADRATLLGRTRRRSTGQGLALRACLILACAAFGVSNLAIAKQLHIGKLMVGKWCRRFPNTLEHVSSSVAYFPSARALEHAIRSCSAHNNAHPKPFVWHKTVENFWIPSPPFANELTTQDTKNHYRL